MEPTVFWSSHLLFLIQKTLWAISLRVTQLDQYIYTVHIYAQGFPQDSGQAYLLGEGLRISQGPAL